MCLQFEQSAAAQRWEAVNDPVALVLVSSSAISKKPSVVVPSSVAPTSASVSHGGSFDDPFILDGDAAEDHGAFVTVS